MIRQPPCLKSGNAGEPKRFAKERLEPLPDDIAALVESIRNPKGAISVAAAAKRLRARPPLDDETAEVVPRSACLSRKQSTQPRRAEISEANMPHTVDAVIDEQGQVRLLTPLKLAAAKRALVTILEDEIPPVQDSTLMSEAALAEDWNRQEEDEAWAHLQKERSY